MPPPARIKHVLMSSSVKPIDRPAARKTVLMAAVMLSPVSVATWCLSRNLREAYHRWCYGIKGMPLGDAWTPLDTLGGGRCGRF